MICFLSFLSFGFFSCIIVYCGHILKSFGNICTIDSDEFLNTKAGRTVKGDAAIKMTAAKSNLRQSFLTLFMPRRQVDEAGELFVKEKTHGIHRTVTVLGDDQFGDVLILGIRIIIIFAIQKHNNISILF